MENQQFKIGDVVQLKSGGPKMTIGSYAVNGGISGLQTGYLNVSYFADNVLQSAEFLPETLELVKE